jgi:hypothetical protein
VAVLALHPRTVPMFAGPAPHFCGAALLRADRQLHRDPAGVAPGRNAELGEDRR